MALRTVSRMLIKQAVAAPRLYALRSAPATSAVLLHRAYSSQTNGNGNGEPAATTAGATTAEATANADAAALSAKLTASETARSEAEAKLSEMKKNYMLALADMENLRQRTTRDIDQAKQFAIQKFAKDLLDTTDILAMALKAVPEQLRASKNAEHKELVDLYTGVRMTSDNLLSTLRRHGVEVVDPIGQQFDPNLHQALYQAPMPGKEHNSVLSVEKLGYTLNGRVIRPAQVGVVVNQ
ncbi:GrpE-domain-containing protein [Ramicandelaber brevisporus]|nr:GrpE-domain-containing protein [Ramicandelaber brevisporus]